ncbi:MAG: hypothetical protein OXH59_08635 [Rhodospirillaceae bacterium]|nr:hypothetical protein [Rhodospirillaceae bacterium]
MTKSVGSGRRVAVLASVLGAALALSACGFLDDALKGTNPIAKELDRTARKGASDRPDRSLSIPPGYSLLPPVDAAGSGSAPGAATGGKAGDGAAGAPASKKIDLGAARGGEAVTRQTVVTNRGTVKEESPGGGEKEPSNRPARKN